MECYGVQTLAVQVLPFLQSVEVLQATAVARQRPLEHTFEPEQSPVEQHFWLFQYQYPIRTMASTTTEP